jgi:hypothetical protein
VAAARRRGERQGTRVQGSMGGAGTGEPALPGVPTRTRVDSIVGGGSARSAASAATMGHCARMR